jgi:phage gp29-like protein
MAKKGLWASPTEFRSFAAVDKTVSLSAEIATRQRSIDFYALGMYLPNPDPVLKKMGKDITVYKELRSDPIVRGCITQRKARTKKLLWEIDRGKAKSRQAKLVTDIFNRLPVRRMINQILDAPLFGNKVLEVMWDVKTWQPLDVMGKPQQWFVYDENNKLKFRTRENWNGIDLREKKFLVAVNDGDYENPYGDAVLSSCFWPVTFRRGGYKFWITFTEKFGMPFIVGKQPRNTDPVETAKFADSLEAMVQDAIAVIPDDASVEIPETKNTGSADLYHKLIQACESDINVAILAHASGAQSTPGKLGNEDQAGETGENVGSDDQHLVEDTLNTLIDWICEYNFAERADRPRFVMYEEEDVDLDQSTRDKNLAETGQVRFKKPYFMKTYGFEEEDIDVVEAAPPALPEGGNVGRLEGGKRPGQIPVQFSAPLKKSIVQKIGDIFTSFMKSPDPDPIDSAMAELSPAELQTEMEGILKPVITLINNGSSYEDIMTGLAKQFPKMDAKGLEEILSRAIFVSECWGRLTAGKG